MEALNHALFLWINAPAEPAAATVRLAMFFAEYAIWLAPLALVAGWLWGEPSTRRHALQAAVAAVLALLINVGFGLAWDHPGRSPSAWAATCWRTWRMPRFRAIT